MTKWVVTVGISAASGQYGCFAIAANEFSGSRAGVVDLTIGQGAGLCKDAAGRWCQRRCFLGFFHVQNKWTWRLFIEIAVVGRSGWLLSLVSVIRDVAAHL
ncbi:hypothetical protein PstZobell_18065 [Stutzerimonas stutzeri ATCC 14405 = CCUG 16156]|nr:hypothetical protein PstZobell_18065 [Stutzerimonas stutzeri ATCC 14405 = CCUG 16156]